MKEFLAKQLGEQFGMNAFFALLIVAVISAVAGFLGRMAWGLVSSISNNRKYGGWVLEVKNGNSKRHWVMPIDKEIIRSLKKKNYLAFKRDLGTAFSGEGNVNFSFGSLISEPMKKNEPQAPGLVIDHTKKRITMDFAQQGNLTKT